MSRPLSQLIYHRVQAGSGTPRVITLHKYKQFAPDVQEYGLAAAPDGRVIGLQSYKGVYVGRDIVGYTWCIGPLALLSPIYFGDGHAEIERFLAQPGPREWFDPDYPPRSTDIETESWNSDPVLGMKIRDFIFVAGYGDAIELAAIAGRIYGPEAERYVRENRTSALAYRLHISSGRAAK